jgi:apolipoprotein N-acyltransferase
VGLIQGNIPQDEKINYNFAEEVNEKQVSMTRSLAHAARPDIIFWSESSTLFPLHQGGTWTTDITDVVKQEKIPLFLGSDAYIADRVYNSAFLIDTNGNILPLRYSKMYLVPFGEYVPFQKLLFFAGKVVPEISDFTAGDTHTMFPLKGRKFGVNICFEVVFPQLSRTFVRNGANLLTTITNDAWFGKSCAPYQHFAMACMRAIENKRYLVRAANTGISGIVDPYGRILQKTDIFVPAVLSGKVKWIDEMTLYSLLGDIVVYVSLGVAIIVLILSFRSPVRRNLEAAAL